MAPLHAHRTRHLQSPPSTLQSNLASGPLGCEFAPTPNRYSVLAELDQSQTQTRWALDFVQKSRLATRRSKRASKHNRLRYASRSNRKARNDEGLEDLRNAFAVLPLTAPSQKLPPSIDAVQHHWAPDHQSTEKLQITSPRFQEPEPWLRDGVNVWAAKDEKVTQKDASFFPLAAFLASPSTAEQRTLSGKPTVPIIDQETQAPHTSAITTSSAPKETAAAACQALASHDIPSAFSTEQQERLAPAQHQPAPLRSPREATISQSPTVFSITRDMLNTPCSITPSRVATPKLTTASAPMLESPLSLDSCIQRDVGKKSPTHSTSGSGIRCSPVFGGNENPNHNLFSIWDTVPIEFPRKYLNQVRSDTSNASSPPTRFAKIFQSQALLNDSTTDEGFFEMGHGKPCWCSHFGTSPSTNQRDCSVNWTLEQPVNSPNTSRKRKCVESPETASPVELKPLSLETPTNSDSDFEHISANSVDLCSPITDDCWNMVTSDMRSRTAETSASPTSDNATEVDVMSWPNSPPNDTKHETVPFVELDIEALLGRLSKSGSSLPLPEIWPALPVSLPSTPAPAVALTESPLRPGTVIGGGISIETAPNAAGDQAKDLQSSVNSPLLDAFNVWSMSPQNNAQAAGTVTTSSMEWPTLSKAVGLKRTRMCIDSSLDEDEDDKSWDKFADWSVL